MESDPGFFPDTERRRLRSLVDADWAVADELHADDYQLITPNGYALTKDEYLDSIASGRLRYHLFEPVSEIKVRAGGQIALVRYKARISVQSDRGPVATFMCWHTDSYEFRDAHWRAVWSQATSISPQAAKEQSDDQ